MAGFVEMPVSVEVLFAYPAGTIKESYDLLDADSVAAWKLNERLLKQISVIATKTEPYSEELKDRLNATNREARTIAAQIRNEMNRNKPSGR